MNAPSNFDARVSKPARRRRAIDITEVARLAGVSIATVSRALTMPGRVKEATRERVLEVVRETGYTPNVAGRSLRAARSMSVLVVVPTFITPFFSELLLGVDRALSSHGYGLLIGNLHDGQEKEARLVDLVLAGQVDGVLLLNGQMLRGKVRSLADATVPIVAVSVPASLPGVPSVLVDERCGGLLAARHLLELGHARFAYISGPSGNYIDLERWAGFTEALALSGITSDRVARYEGDYHAASGVAAARQFLEQPVRPTAVFAASDMMAIAFMRTVNAAGLRVPADVSIVGFDGIEFATLCEPPLTTIRQPREAMGREAAELLLQLIAGQPIPAERQVATLPVVLQPGGSTAPPARAGRAHRSRPRVTPVTR